MIKDKIGKILAAAAEKIIPSLFIFVLNTETNMFYNYFSFVNSDHSLWNSCIHKAKHKMHRKHMWGIHMSSFRCR